MLLIKLLNTEEIIEYFTKSKALAKPKEFVITVVNNNETQIIGDKSRVLNLVSNKTLSPMNIARFFRFLINTIQPNIYTWYDKDFILNIHYTELTESICLALADYIYSFFEDGFVNRESYIEKNLFDVSEQYFYTIDGLNS